jgi:transposase
MKVTAFDEPTFYRMKSMKERAGTSYRQLARDFCVSRKTIARAFRLYEDYGRTIFDPEKVPQRGGKRYREGQRKERVHQVNQRIMGILLKSTWNENLAPRLRDN